MSGVKAFLILATVIVFMLAVLILVAWVVHHSASWVVDNTP